MADSKCALGSGVKSNEVNTGRFRIKEEDNIYPLYKQIYSHIISLFLFIFVSIVHGHDLVHSSCPRFGRDNAELIQKVAKNVMNAELPVRNCGLSMRHSFIFNAVHMIIWPYWY
jgi:hypothetical protein